MRTIAGKTIRDFDRATVAAWAAGYREVMLDLGTGDGRFVLDAARHDPERAVIGLDACGDGLRRGTRRAPNNALFVVASALALMCPRFWSSKRMESNRLARMAAPVRQIGANGTHVAIGDGRARRECSTPRRC